MPGWGSEGQARGGKPAGGWVYYDPEFYGPRQAGFWQADTCNARLGNDHSGMTTVAFDIRKSRQAEFKRYTGKHVGRRLCVVLCGWIIAAPVIVRPVATSVEVPVSDHLDEAVYLLHHFRHAALPMRVFLESNIEMRDGDGAR